MFKTLAKSIREFKRDSLLSPFFVTLEVLCEILIPLIMAILIDEILANDITNLVMLGGALLILAMLGLYFGYLSGK